MFSGLFEISVYKNAYVQSLLERLVEGQSRNCCVEFISERLMRLLYFSIC